MIAQSSTPSTIRLNHDEEGLATLLDARKVAAVLRQAHPHEIHAIWLFGSVAHSYIGAELDLLLEVDEITFMEYLKLGGTWSDFQYREHRFVAAGVALVMAKDYSFTWTSEIAWNWHCIDLHVFPTDWRNQLSELQVLLGHHDPKFMDNLAREAIRL